MIRRSSSNPSLSVASFESATGNIRFTLTNDFMFHVVLEENTPALRKLLSSLLHMLPEEIITIEIKNPIDYGTFMDDKKVILDLKLLLNEFRVVNIEMQVLDDSDWLERSVIYLCRCYDNVSKGNEYDSVMPAHHISIIDFNLEGTAPEFYSTHHLRNDKTGAVYTGNFALSVLNLKQIDIATDEDKKWQIDRWGRFFKATSWEELRMIAANDVEMTNMAQTLYDKNQDEYARNWALAREMYLFDERRRKAREKKALEELAETKRQTAELKKEYAKIRKESAELKKESAELKKESAALKKESAALKKESDRLRSILIANDIDPDA